MPSVTATQPVIIRSAIAFQAVERFRERFAHPKSMCTAHQHSTMRNCSLHWHRWWRFFRTVAILLTQSTALWQMTRSLQCEIWPYQTLLHWCHSNGNASVTIFHQRWSPDSRPVQTTSLQGQCQALRLPYCKYMAFWCLATTWLISYSQCHAR